MTYGDIEEYDTDSLKMKSKVVRMKRQNITQTHKGNKEKSALTVQGGLGIKMYL